MYCKWLFLCLYMQWTRKVLQRKESQSSTETCVLYKNRRKTISTVVCALVTIFSRSVKAEVHNTLLFLVSRLLSSSLPLIQMVPRRSGLEQGSSHLCPVNTGPLVSFSTHRAAPPAVRRTDRHQRARQAPMYVEYMDREIISPEKGKVDLWSQFMWTDVRSLIG